MHALFLGLAVVSGLAVLLVAGKLLWGSRAAGSAVGGRLPMTPLEKRAWVGLGLGAIAIAGAMAVMALRGLELYDDDPTTRFAIYGLLLLGVGAQAAVAPRTPGGRLRPWVDERDLRIIERAPAYQGIAVLFSLAVWAVGLTESYRSGGTIPIVYPSLIFLSSLLVYSVALSAGILIGSRRALDDGQG